MPTRLDLDGTLSEAIARARRRASAAGELSQPKIEFSSPLSEPAREALAGWLRSGGYAAAVADVVADDPELANQ